MATKRKNNGITLNNEALAILAKLLRSLASGF
jgi:urease gamma subunit